MSNATANPYWLTWTHINDWCIVYGIEAFIDVFANGLTIFVILYNQFLHKRFFYLLLSLAVADLLVGAVACPMFIYVLWGFYSPEAKGKIDPDVVKAQTLVEILTSYASIFALVAIAVERLIAVMFPNFHRNESKISYITTILVTWLLAVMVGLLFLTNFMNLKHPFHFHLLMVLLALSLLTVLVCYIIIAVKLFQSRTESVTTRENRERHIALTLLVASALFVALWMPFQVTNYIFHFNVQAAISHHLIYASKFLHYLNSIINPIVYALMMKDFRRGLKNVLCCHRNKEVTAPAGGHVNAISGPRSNQGYVNDEATMTHVSQVL